MGDSRSNAFLHAMIFGDTKSLTHLKGSTQDQETKGHSGTEETIGRWFLIAKAMGLDVDVSTSWLLTKRGNTFIYLEVRK